MPVKTCVVPLREQVQGYVDKQVLGGAPLWNKSSIVCCSAGADSTYLAYVMAAMCSSGDHHLVYFNHGQRPDAIPTEIAHIQALGKELGMQVHIIELTIQKVTQDGFRAARLEALSVLCKKINVSTVFLGHHLDDDLETFWMQLCKGATVGLRGIPFCTEYNNMQLLHPLLCLTKTNILDALQAIGATYCTDNSNFEDTYTRNRVRAGMEDLIQQVPNGSLHNGFHALQYLKSMQHTLRNQVMDLVSRMVHIDGCVLVRKADVLALFNVPEYGVSVWMADSFNQYMNREQCALLAHNLNTSSPTQLVLQDVVICMDYDWLCVQPNDWVSGFSTSTCLQPGVAVTELGTTCVTEGTGVLASSKNMLSVPDLHGLQLGVISGCGLRIPDHKKRCRDAGVSPILQRWWPVLFSSSTVMFVPGVYVDLNIQGHIYITMQGTMQFSILQNKKQSGTL
jgi:tRNA(Ile)-lysidine synthetase-like protein